MSKKQTEEKFRCDAPLDVPSTAPNSCSGRIQPPTEIRTRSRHNEFGSSTTPLDVDRNPSSQVSKKCGELSKGGGRYFQTHHQPTRRHHTESLDLIPSIRTGSTSRHTWYPRPWCSLQSPSPRLEDHPQGRLASSGLHRCEQQGVWVSPRITVL